MSSLTSVTDWHETIPERAQSACFVESECPTKGLLQVNRNKGIYLPEKSFLVEASSQMSR